MQTCDPGQRVDRRLYGGYPVSDELPTLLLLFVVPAAAGVLLRWRFL
jgi:hypothetical protein